MSNLVAFYRNLDKKYQIIFWVAIIDVLIIIAIAIFFFTYRLNNEPDNVTITNWNEYASEVPSEYQKATEQTITHILTAYNKLPADTFVDAAIRSDTYYANQLSTDDSTNNYKVGFIVDIATLEQSYKVNFNYNTKIKKDSDFQIDVTCPTYTQVIYPQSKCATSDDPFDDILQYLDFYGTLPKSQATVTIKKQTYGSDREYPGASYLAVAVDSCDDFNIVAEGKDYIKSWLQERYLDPNDFHYEVFNSCGL